MKMLVILLLVGAAFADDSLFGRIRNGDSRGDCYSNPCRNGGVCLTSSSNGWDPRWGSVNFYCKCPRDYSGTRCEHYESSNPVSDYCHRNNPCRNGGVCLTSSSRDWDPRWGAIDFYCRCPIGYSGTRCERDERSNSDYCYSNPCRNGGVCLTSSSPGWDRSWGSVNFYCKCPRDYSGTRCEHYESSNPVSDYCHRNNPCRNGGVCLTSSSRDWDPRWGAIDFYCRCPTGYSGTRCERDESSNSDYCHSNPCRNGGVCLTSSSNGWNPSWGSVNFYCKCPTGYTGRRCENYRDRDEQRSCGTYDCRNGGHCVWKHGVQICECLPSWGGPSCESRKYN